MGLQVSECGPLSCAVLMRSEKSVNDMLSRYPLAVIQERNRLGHTTLHLACGWPVGLKLLLEAGGARVVNTPSNFGRIPLMYAHAVRCLDSMALLIEAGSALSSLKWRGHLTWTLSSSEESLDMVIRYNDFGFDLIYATMRQRQNKLEVMARQNLPAEVFEALGVPNTGILEGSLIYHLVRILSKYNITIPDELKLPDQQGTVYHAIRSCLNYNTMKHRMLPQKFFDAGFCCIDELNCRGLSPLASIYPKYI
jgi:hypothetical protein